MLITLLTFMVSGVVHAKIVSRIQDLNQGVHQGKASFSYGAYDGEGNKLTETDELGRITRFEYDGNQRHDL